MLPSQLAGSQQYTATTPSPARATGARRQVKLVGGRGGRLGHPLEAQLGVGLGLLWEREIGNMSGAHTTAGATAVGCPPGGLGCGQGPTGHWRPGRAECVSTRGPCWPCEGRLGGARVIPQYRMMPQGRVRLIPARDGRRRDSVCREGEVNWAAAGHTARVSFGPLPQSAKQAA